MKKMVLVLLLFISINIMWANPHPVFIEVIDSGGNAPLADSLSFTATILDSQGGIPVGNTLTEDSFDCAYPSEEYEGLIKINLGQFTHAWNDSSYMRVTVSLETGEPDQSKEFLLSYANYQLFTGADGIQLGIIEEEVQTPDVNGDITFLFDHGNNSRADDIQVNVNSDATSEEDTLRVVQYERASYTIPNYRQTIDLGFDFDDRDLNATSIDVEIRWNLPVPDLSNPTLIYKASDQNYWRVATVTNYTGGTYTSGWDLAIDDPEPDGYTYGVMFTMTDFTPGSATYTKWAIGENTILDLQPAVNVAISSSVIGTEASTATLSLSWNEVIGADTYDILVSDSYSGTYTVAETGLTSESGTVTLSNSTANEIKYYKVQGIKNDSATDYVDTAVSTDVMAGISYGVKTTLITNNALIAFPVDGYSSYTDASDLIGFIDECDCISQWDADTQSWNSMGRIFGDFAGWDTSLDFALEANTPVVFNVMSGIDNLVLAGDVNTSVEFTLKARAQDAVTYNYIYLPLDSAITSGQALATDITNCTYVGKFDYDSQDWEATVNDGSWNDDITIAAGDLLRVGITGSSNITWPSGN